MKMPKIGIIGGSGVYDPDLFKNVTEKEITTPFGEPSANPLVGEIKGEKVAFIPRHGDAHQHNPTEVNSRANIFAFKKLGVERILATNAVGSLKEKIGPEEIVIPDQIFDRTKKRETTFFEGGIVAHVEFAEPFCKEINSKLIETAKKNHSTHTEGTYVCIEGPMFSTKAESEFYRNQGFDIIGMTAIPEAKLAREAEICYSMIATVTDYDVWKEDEEEVTMELILKRMQKNEEKIKDVLSRVIPKIPEERSCQCGRALKNSITTPRKKISQETIEKLEPIIRNYF